MCIATATAMSGLGLLTGIYGTVSTVHGQQQAAKQSQTMAQYNSDISRRNADLAEIKAADTLAQGQKDQEKIRREYKARVGQMATKFGAGNVALDSGSALDMIVDTTEVGELDALDIGAKAQRQSQDYLRAAADARNQATLSMQQGNAAASAGASNTGNSLLNGLESIGNDSMDLFTGGKQDLNQKTQKFSAAQNNFKAPNYSRSRGPSYF